MSGVDDIAFLSGSEARVDVLRLLKAEGPLTRRELRRRCEAANVTLSRNLEKLREQGWIVEEERSYELTIRGEEIANQFFDLLGTVEQVNRLETFLRWAPKGELDLDFGELAEAEITVGAKHNPFAPIGKYVDLLQGATHAQIMLQPVGLKALQTAEEDLVVDDARYEIVVEDDFVRSLASSEECLGVLGRLAESEASSVTVHENELPFCLVVTDSLVQIGVQDEHNHPRALVQSDSETVYTWARRKFRAFREGARPLVASEFA